MISVYLEELDTLIFNVVKALIHNTRTEIDQVFALDYYVRLFVIGKLLRTRESFKA
jgi:hypothetical protein